MDAILTVILRGIVLLSYQLPVIALALHRLSPLAVGFDERGSLCLLLMRLWLLLGDLELRVERPQHGLFVVEKKLDLILLVRPGFTLLDDAMIRLFRDTC